jgi:hypothetical protein
MCQTMSLRTEPVPDSARSSAIPGSCTSVARTALDSVVTRDEVARAVRRIRGMHGVDRVENRLELRADPAELPGAQSPIPDLPRDPRLDLTRRRWSPSERAEGVALGGGLLLDGVRRGGLSGAALGFAGLLVLFRALTNKPLTERFTRRERRERVATRTALPAATEPTRPPLWSRA